MSASKLGPLPEFGRKRGGLAGSVGVGGSSRSQLDDALGSLLGSDEHDDQSRLSTKDPQARTKKKKAEGSDGSNFYSKLANPANQSFEDSEEENLAVTEEDAKKLANSVDIDDMDASLFTSFSQNQKKTSHSRAKSSRLQSGQTRKVQVGAAKSEESQSSFTPLEDEEFHHEIKKAENFGAPQQPPARKLKQEREMESEPSAPRGSLKPKKTDLDDDLLDLLSDDDTPKKRTKPRIQLRTSRPPKMEGSTAVDALHQLQSDGKPITSGEKKSETENLVDTGPSMSMDGGREATTSELDGVPDRPRTSHGRLRMRDTTTSSEAVKGSGGDSGPTILKLDSPMHQSAPSRKPRGSINVDFNDDDDDILSGMGLEDEAPPLRSSAGGLVRTSRERRGSKLDELLGTAPKKPVKTTKLGTESANTVKTKAVGPTTNSGLNTDSNGEEDDYQFGGYIPSVASGEAGKPTGLPSGRRRRLSSDGESLSLTSRPNSAPAKKSVRFADTIETSDRPSSSPSVSEGAKMPLKGSRKLSEPKEGESVSRKPPLPRKSETEREARKPVEKDSGGGGGGGESTSDSTAATEHADSQSNLNGEELIGGDSLLSWDESTPKHSTRGRGRSSSIQKPSSAAKLFEESQEEQTLGPPADETSTGEPPPEAAVAEKNLSASEKLEYPAFPWSQGSGKNKPSLGDRDMPGTSQSAPPSLQSSFTRGATGRQSDGGPETSLQAGQLALMQEQLLQQQRQAQEQMLQLQALGGQLQSQEARKARGSLSPAEGEGLRSELKTAQERVRELEGDLGKEKTEHTEQQRRLLEVQEQLQSSVEAQKKAEEEWKALRERNGQLESVHQKSQLELTSTIDELKLKLHRLELERDQLRQSQDAAQTRHAEEIEAIQNSNVARVQALEESYQRREARWREEAESEASRFQERLQQAEREKSDAVLSLRKKLDTAEVARSNETARLQEVHRTVVEDLKREHEVDRQHLHSLHQQEITALKAAHSHSHTLSVLTRQVEASTREVSQLQAKVDHAHSQGVQDREYSTRAQEEHLKLLEERLSKQQLENEQERERLQTLTAKMEAHITQQARQLEQERWQLQQEAGRLRAQQTAFEEERTASLQKLEEEREQLQQAKERLLVEQREVLAQCYEERRSLASERAELSLLQKRALEREQREAKKSIQTEAEVEAALSQLREEGARVEAEGACVREEGERVKRERQALERDRERMEAFGTEIQQRAREIEEMCQSAVHVREQGEQALSEAQRLQLQSLEKSRELEAEAAALRERERQFANEQLALARERRELQHRSILRSTHNYQSQAESLTLLPKEGSSSQTHPPMSSSLPPLHTYPMAPSPASDLPGRAYTPVHMHYSVRPTLSRLQHTNSLRRMTLEAEKDEEDLEEECKFLESLKTFSDLHGSIVAT